MAEKNCGDRNCIAHKNLLSRGRVFKGTVMSSKAQKTAIVAWDRKVYVPKYERYEVRKSRVAAHNPACINAQKGDIVRIEETRKLSKTKSFVITEKFGENIVFLEAEQEKALAKEEKVKVKEGTGERVDGKMKEETKKRKGLLEKGEKK